MIKIKYSIYSFNYNIYYSKNLRKFKYLTVNETATITDITASQNNVYILLDTGVIVTFALDNSFKDTNKKKNFLHHDNFLMTGFAIINKIHYYNNKLYTKSNNSYNINEIECRNLWDFRSTFARL